MEDLRVRIQQLKSSLQIETKTGRVNELAKMLEDPAIWQDHTHAANIAQELTRLKSEVEQWQHVHDLIEAAGEQDRPEIMTELDQLETATYLNGPNDNLPVILSIHAGTGGVEAMDWAAMLLRMYLRYAERQGWAAVTLDTNPGEEAGLKNVTVRISGSYTYGYLKNESGVHRLVRLSPFNADHLRQTSFALVEVVPEIDRPTLQIPEKDLKIDVFRASGHGGQGVNTTDSAVRLTHIPTGITVTCQNERSQLQNKESALRILESRLTVQMERERATELSQLKPNVQGSWGNQIRSYVMQPYTLVKDHRTNTETSDVQAVLDGGLDLFIQSELKI